MTIEIEGEYTTARVQGDEEMFDETFFDQVQSIVDHKAFKNDIVIMPDGHAGAGAVIGFTMPVGERLTPNVVGSDIGCGVTAVNIGDHLDGDITPEEVDERIREVVPMGLGQTHSDSDYHIVNDFPWEKCREIREEYDDGSSVEDECYTKEYLMNLCDRVGIKMNNLIASMGTLGSGNHFLEVSQSSETGEYWIVVHSGSRCVGGAIASYWQDKAEMNVDCHHIFDNVKEWMWDYIKFDGITPVSEVRQWVYGGKGESFYKMDKIREEFDGEEIEERRQDLISLIPENRNNDLDYIEYAELDGYITDMVFAQQYARENRKHMLRAACDALDVEMGEMIDSIHNYIDFTDGVIRKGATRSHSGERLVIPFNMADGAVICRGKGNNGFNRSAPHGAGRRGSRTWAYNEFTVGEFEDLMQNVHSSNDKEEVLDEIPKAYKSPDKILNWLDETAEIEEELIPIVNMKGE